MIKRELGHRVSPRSKKEIMMIALEIRKLLQLENTKKINLVGLVELFIHHDLMEIVEDSELEGRYALTYPDENLIKIRNSVYDDLCNGSNRARFTIAHEIGHLFMHKNQSAFARGGSKNHKIYEDGEWQADTFASYFLINKDLVDKSMTANDISRTFGVSYTAAETWLSKNR
ncbi:ImmA/IrrE family metallo-endopeptidase [Providencia manganoxydans]|uniref:ImmA/IrrE family metallo-endopeptidase n=1 Tax=Providencia manganoxydans TaxID=2923283 RepID=UPI0032DBB3AD